MQAKVEKLVLESATKLLLTVSSGEATFTPVSFNSFQVGTVTVQAELPKGSDVNGALEEMSEIVRSQFSARYQERLGFYCKALAYNDKKLREARESARG